MELAGFRLDGSIHIQTNDRRMYISYIVCSRAKFFLLVQICDTWLTRGPVGIINSGRPIKWWFRVSPDQVYKCITLRPQPPALFIFSADAQPVYCIKG